MAKIFIVKYFTSYNVEADDVAHAARTADKLLIEDCKEREKKVLDIFLCEVEKL